MFFKIQNSSYYFFFSIIFLFASTNFMTSYELINIAGQNDIEQYFLIAKEAPQLPNGNKDILAHVSSRYFIPYISGLISYFFDIELFRTYQFINFFFLTLFAVFLLDFLKIFDLNQKEKIIFFSVVFFNPYIVRYHIFNPVQAHDLLFFSLTVVYAKGLITNNIKILLITSLAMILIRQSSIAFFLGNVAYLLLNRNKNYYFIFLYILSFICIFYINSLIGKSISLNSFDMRYAYGIIYYDFGRYLDLIKFLILPFISFFPLILLIILSFKLKSNLKINIILPCLVIVILMIGQPVMAGPDFTQRNIMRISSLCYVILTFLIFYTLDHKKIINNKILYFLFIAGLLLWSLHPLYSTSNLFNFLRF